MTAPLCFASPRLFELWLMADMALPRQQRCENVCRDCMPSYQMRMRKQGRCGHPETVFSVDRDGGVVGVPA